MLDIIDGVNLVNQIMINIGFINVDKIKKEYKIKMISKTKINNLMSP